MTGLLLRLKQRKLVQWALAYLAGAWVLLQVLDLIGDRFGWPAGLLRGAVIAVGVGFLVTLLLAWYHGERGAQKVSGIELLLLALVLAVGGGLLWRYSPAPAAAQPNPVADATVARANPRPAAPPGSIAVLPFVNMSGDPGNEYFSEGISEEILNVLARTPQLQVAARTSSFSFKGKPMEVPEIAQALNVRMVLEGSVRKQGERVRITAQLIDGASDLHLWSQTYDRQLKDIFAIQDEIAQSVAAALKVKLAVNHADGGNSVGTTDLEAYDAYLRGMALWQTRREVDLWQAIDLFKQATTADPEFAQGYAGLALAYAVIGDYSMRIDYPESFALAKDFAERTLALDPASPEAYAVLALVATKEYRRATAAALFRRALALRPSFASAWQWHGALLFTSGDLAGGLAAIERAAVLDPRSAVIAQNHVFVLRTLARYDNARDVCARALTVAAGNPYCLEDVAMIDLRSHDFEAARAALERLTSAINPGASGQGRELIAAIEGGAGRHALAQRYAALSLRSDNDPGAGNALMSQDIATVLVLLGENGLALDYLDRLTGLGTDDASWAVMLPSLDPIRCTPRFKAVIARLKTSDPHAARVCGGAS